MDNIKGAWLTTNRTCNNNCNFCYAHNAKADIMAVDECKKCIDSVSLLGIKHLVLIGGEPTMHPNIIELVEYSTKKDISISLATNGRKFSDKNFAKKIIAAGLRNINISIKGTSENEYLERTNSIGCAEMISGYKNIELYGIHPIISYVITSNNKQDFDNLIQFVENNNMNNLLIQFVKPILELNSPSIMSQIEMGEFVSYIYERMQRSQISYKIEVSFPICLINENILNNLINEDKISTCCHLQAGRGIVFDTKARILPCNHFIDLPYDERPVGTMGVKYIENVWHSEVVQNFRSRASCYPSSKCKDCERWDLCGGGCFTRWLYDSPDDVIQ